METTNSMNYGGQSQNNTQENYTYKELKAADNTYTIR